MPSYAEVLTNTYLPAQAAKLRWESAKTVAGAQFDALAEQRKAVDEVRLRRQQYADNIRPREGNDAFLMSALSAGLQPSGGGVGTKPNAAYTAGLEAVGRIPQNATANDPNVIAAEAAIRAAPTKEAAAKLAKDLGAKTNRTYVVPAGLKTQAQVDAERGAAASKSKQQGVTVQEMRELADSLGGRAFQGGEEARLYYKNLPPEDQEALTLYQNALLDDGVVSPEELPEGMRERGEQMYKTAAAKGAYRRQDRGAYDEGYLDLLKDLSVKETKLKEAEGRLQGKTKETFAEELYTGASERAAIPPLLRSLEGDMKGFLEGYTAAQASDPKTDAESYLRSKLTDREAKGFSAASAMAASGMRAQDIMDNLQALSPEERRKVMGALASRDAIASTQMKVAPGTPLPEIEKIQAEDRRAQEAELARTESRLQRRLRQIDESLAESRKSGFGGLVSPDTGARRQVLMGALSPEEVRANERAADEEEVARVGARLDRERLEQDRLMDTGMGDYDPATRLPAPAPPRLDPNRGNKTAGEEDRRMRARYEASEAEGRVDQALREYQDYSGALNPQAAAAVRGALMQGLAPKESIGPSRADLRPEAFEFDQAAPPPAPEPTPEPMSEADTIRAKLRSGAYPKGSPERDDLLDRLDALEGK